MKDFIIPKDYQPALNIRQTEVAIKDIKDFFERALAKKLNLTRVSAPLFVKPETGLNDNLNGVERPVSFGIREQNDAVCEIVHSLAKWKRKALKTYGFDVGEGLYTDMNAIRRDEDTDNMHSIYVDQWDWELVLNKSDRNYDFLVNIVNKIYECFLEVQEFVYEKYGNSKKLPEKITFVTTQELEDLYPNLTPKEREKEYSKKYGAIFISQIGGRLKSGNKHDGRAPDYDDWSLNGDIVFYYPLLDIPFEVSSMGIRVDEDSLVAQLTLENCLDRLALPFQKELAEKKLPYTVGGGLGQSRICMFFLDKAHIGEVQSSIWTDEDRTVCEQNNINLL